MPVAALLRRLPVGLALLLFTTFLGCTDENPVEAGGEAVYTVQLVSGDDQAGLQGTALPEPGVLRVVDGEGRPGKGVLLQTQVTEGGGQVLSTPLRTDDEGRAELAWQLGDDYAQALKVWAAEQPATSVTARAVARYRYRPPAQTGDGWDVAALDTTRPATTLLLDGIDEIRKGTFTEVHSLLVTRNGQLLFEIYFPGHNSQGQLIPFERNTPHEVQSASKSFRSMLVGIAVDQGFIAGVEQPLSDFFPEHAALLAGDKEAITLEHILTMSSGLDWHEWDFPFGHSRNTLSTMYGMPYGSWDQYVLSLPLAHPPGSVFVYNTGASIMLNRIVINASGINLDPFVRRYYTGLVESTRLPGVGNPLGATTLPRDMAKFGQVYLDGGRWKGTRVVSEAWVEESFRPRFQVNDAGYGYQWWIRTLRTPNRAYQTQYASGNGGQFVFVVRDLDLVVVATGGHFGSSTMFQMYPFLETYVLPAFE